MTYLPKIGLNLALFLCAILLSSVSDAQEESTPAATLSPPPTVLVLVPTGNEVKEASRRTVANLVSVEFQNLGYEVITADDVKKMLELEAQKQASGCMDESCLADIAGALGAERVVFGDVGMLGSTMIFTFNLYNSDKARSTGRVSLKVKSLEEIPDLLPAAMTKLVGKNALLAKNTTASTASSPSASAKAPVKAQDTTSINTTSAQGESQSTFNWAGWSLTGLGAGIAAIGMVLDLI